MKQIIQGLGDGSTSLIDVARPAVGRNNVVIDSSVSLISAGTERMLVGFGKASMISKAKQQPEKVRQVLDKVKTDGLFTTIDAVRSKLGQPIPLGYCNVGVIGEVGRDVQNFAPGDRVVSNGSHAETVRVPTNLCARIPDNVSDEMAAFTVIASIGLQGIRLAQPAIGETVVVMGTGLIGLLTVQMLIANGCRVLATDFDSSKLALAKKWGAEICDMSAGEDPVAKALAFSGGIGVDAVLITASTPSNDPMKQAATMSRKRGRIVLVGVVGLQLDRADFYEKELSFQVSCSYGPGRYDPTYEEGGQDYPIGFVRWTEQRNFEAVLSLMAAGRIDVSDMITQRAPFEGAPDVYDRLVSDKSMLGVLLTYGSPMASRASRIAPVSTAAVSGPSAGLFAMVGAGNYATRMLLPAFKDAGAHFGTIVSSAGLTGAIAGEKFGFERSSTDLDQMLGDDRHAAVLIATQHDSHAAITAKALKAGRDVFVEKPLAIDREGLSAVRAAFDERLKLGHSPRLMVGFNRRWAPMVQKMKGLLDSVAAPKSFILTMNAGDIPSGHWTQDRERGGGRIIGEACHFIDLMRFLAGHPISSISASSMGKSGAVAICEDKAFIVVNFVDGSHGVINYLANGSSEYPKERIEAFANGGILQLDNYRSLKGYGWRGFSKMSSFRQDKGQEACAKAFYKSVSDGGANPIPIDEIFEIADWTITAAEQIRGTRP